MKLSILIPAFNEADTIVETIRRVRAAPVEVAREIVVVDDASTDATAAALAALAGPDLRVIRHPDNRGKGAALRTALAASTGSLLLVQDADLEYFPEDYPALLSALDDPDVAAVYGSRFLAGGRPAGMRFSNWLANRVLALAVSLLFGTRITDEATAYKLFRREAIADIALTCRRFEFCPEVTARLLKRGRRIREVPIRYQGRTAAQGKKIHWWDGVVALWTLVKFRFIG